MPFRPKVRCKNIIADYTVTAQDNESYLIAASGADIEFTLPAVADAKDHEFTFVNKQDFEMLITAPDETLVLLNDATADGLSVTTAGQHIGAVIKVVCDVTLYFAMNMSAGVVAGTVVSA